MRRALALACGLVALLPGAIRAQSSVLLQGVLDVEGWKTDTSSSLLSRNAGDPAGLYRLRLWSAVEPMRGVFVFANGLAEGGTAKRFDAPEVEVTLEQGGLRIARHRALEIDAGKMVHPVGAFGSRLLSTRNPLIGTPDAYIPVYPLGLMASGERGMFDYRAALVSLPPTHRDYVPDPDAAMRPTLGLGITPVVGLRVGVNATRGPYLNRDLTASQLNGRGWKSYDQRVLATDAQYGVSHFDLRGEYALTDFAVPRNGRIAGQAGYVELRSTLSPRLFAAVRGEYNEYPFIRPFNDSSWTARGTEFRSIEVGGGFRFGANTLLKASVSADKWTVTSYNNGFVKPGGKALAVQLSRAFDVAAWLDR
jgi:hypothetical protein